MALAHSRANAAGRERTTTMLSHTYSYEECLHNSLKVAWKEEDVLKNREFDYSKRFLPNRLAGVEAKSYSCWITRRGCTLAWNQNQASPGGTGGKRRHPRGHENTGIGAEEPEA
jgi:hypothetical protein